MEESIFTKIVKGEIPCHKIYEDDDILAFLDIKGTVEGHTLVITKQQIEYVWDLDDELYQKLWLAAKKVANRIKEVLPFERVGVKVMGEAVPHVHIHLIPFNDIKEYRGSPNFSVETDNEKLAKTAQKLAF